MKYFKEGLQKIRENLIGGLADKLSVEDIAKKHNVNVEHINNQIEKGMKVEQEHTTDSKIAREISMDHLTEDPDYYTKLAKMEKE